jgi:SAM-dependent methyltransferase
MTQNCRICNGKLTEFFDFGDMPIANGFLVPEEFKNEYFYRMKVGFCPACSMVQLIDQPNPELMFHDHYAFFSSTSTFMARHFRQLAVEVQEKFLANDPFVIELGSNDGILLQNFAQNGIKHLGVEPSGNVAQVAREKGINTISTFFNEATAEEILSEYGNASAILAANVMCHIPDLHSVVRGMKKLLKPDGVIIMEDPNLGDIIEKTSYDQIYDEHVFYFSLLSLSNLFCRYNLEIFDLEHLNVHGGSMRYFIGHKGKYPISDAVKSQAEKEKKMNLSSPEPYMRLKKNIEESKQSLLKILKQMKQERKRVVGYAATSKSTTVTNYCGITPDLVEFISDTTPIKQGKFSPGAHIPVKSHDVFKNNYPEYALLFGWNHSEEIMKNEQAFKEAGGKWIVYVPRVDIL